MARENDYTIVQDVDSQRLPPEIVFHTQDPRHRNGRNIHDKLQRESRSQHRTVAEMLRRFTAHVSIDPDGRARSMVDEGRKNCQHISNEHDPDAYAGPILNGQRHEYGELQKYDQRSQIHAEQRYRRQLDQHRQDDQMAC